MVIRYNTEVSKEAIIKNIDKITNQIFKLLPIREESGDWEAPLRNLIRDICGMDRLLGDQMEFFSLLCKMESLLTLKNKEDFLAFRKGIFECLGLMNELKKCLD